MVLSCFTLLKSYNDSNTIPSISMECCEFILKEIRDKSVSVKIYVYTIHPSIYLHISIYLSTYIYLSIYPSIGPSIHPSTMYLFIYLSIHPLYINYIQLVGESREHEPFINGEEDTPSNNVSLMKFLVFLMKEVSMCVSLSLIL